MKLEPELEKAVQLLRECSKAGSGDPEIRKQCKLNKGKVVDDSVKLFCENRQMFYVALMQLDRDDAQSVEEVVESQIVDESS